ncbi:uncharacterized protein [Struthio camelus]|uniref:uncharacterized protein n=1 Tax=Struthio camelus TaxID=8801 RepID=UPI003603FB78
MRRACHHKGGITETRLKLYSKATPVLYVARITTIEGQYLFPGVTVRVLELHLGKSRTEYVPFLFLLIFRVTFLEELGLAIWQRTFDKKPCKALPLRASEEDIESNLDIAAFFQGSQNTLRTCFSLQPSSHSISMRTLPANWVPKRISEGDTNLFIPTSAWQQTDIVSCWIIKWFVTCERSFLLLVQFRVDRCLHHSHSELTPSSCIFFSS